jgi:hypothetical protein
MHSRSTVLLRPQFQRHLQLPGPGPVARLRCQHQVRQLLDVLVHLSVLGAPQQLTRLQVRGKDIDQSHDAESCSKHAVSAGGYRDNAGSSHRLKAMCHQ